MLLNVDNEQEEGIYINDGLCGEERKHCAFLCVRIISVKHTANANNRCTKKRPTS